MKSQGVPTHPPTKKIFLNRVENNQRIKYDKYFEQQMGTKHPMWYHIDAKLMKVGTIIIIEYISR